ncbi:MAG TPA: galactokinase [Vicinamibacterales bacterium]|nr:galactokinase [Vicinamibacterales bacterium]
MRTFADLYGRPPEITESASGRVNLIGEHTDYNDGFVLPAALPLRTTVALAPRSDATVRVWSSEFPDHEPQTFSIDRITRAHDWTDYVRGMVWVLVESGLRQGFDARVSSEIPLGSGLSSSAALLVAAGRAVRAAFALSIDDLQLAQRARTAETDFVGAPVGIMDQMACSLADESSALFIDTRTLRYERVALPRTGALLVIDSGVRHSHVSGEYRTRREECARAAAALGVKSLREIGEADLTAIDSLPEPLNRRARHVVTENVRVLATVAALRSGDLIEIGRLFDASHASMRDDFQVSTPAVDALVAAAKSVRGVYGARLTGGGFGGSIVGLTEPGRAIAAGEAIIAEQNRRFPNHARVLVPAA